MNDSNALTSSLPLVTSWTKSKHTYIDELARAAFDPDTIATTPQWPAVAAAFLTAYQQAHGPVTREHLAGCHRLALAHHLTDTTDWQHLYLGPYPVHTSVIHRRNAHRDTAITQLINQWDQVEDMMAGIGANPPEKLGP